MKRSALLALTLISLLGILLTSIPFCSATAILYGDADGDGAVKAADLAILRAYLANFDPVSETSSVVLGTKAAALTAPVTGTYADGILYGDTDSNGIINAADLAALRIYLANFNFVTGIPGFQLGPKCTHVFALEADTATCTADGVKTYACAECGTKYDESSAALGHNYVATVTEPTAEAGGYTTYVCSRCSDTYVADYTDPLPPVVETKSIKVLAIGNSFSTDCIQFLWNMLKNAGYDEIILGNLYYGGCSLAEHLSFAQADSKSYSYHKNTSGSWVTTKNYKFSAALTDEDWDIVTFQQTSKTCGLASSYGETLTALVDIVEDLVSPDTKLVWNMTWAYQADSTHSSFPNYNNDQMTMYNMIVDCMESEILTEERFDSYIPVATAIQNARTSFMGDTLTRDGYHLNNFIGRYIAGLCWYVALTGGSVDDITFNPSTDMINDDMIAAAKDAVAAALTTPLAVTPSTVTTGTMAAGSEIDPSVVLNPADFYENDFVIAEDYGYDLSNYTLLTWDYLENTYWNCTSKAGTTTPGASGSTYHQNVCSEKKYSLDEVPIGSLFILDAGTWQYRIEIYDTATAKYTGTRPGFQRDLLFELNDGFLKGTKYLAWNISSYPKTDISEIYAQAACHLRVYVPNAEPAAE